jgi:TM2 domain-containing membrane protein YozV
MSEHTVVYGRVAPEPFNAGTAYLLLCLSFIGICGIQHFYLGKYFRGTFWLLTFGVLGIGTLIDLFTLNSQTAAANYRRGSVR